MSDGLNMLSFGQIVTAHGEKWVRVQGLGRGDYVLAVRPGKPFPARVYLVVPDRDKEGEEWKSMTSETKTPKERFLAKVYSALQEFEDTTGVEVHNIKVERVEVIGDSAGLSEPPHCKWKLTLE